MDWETMVERLQWALDDGDAYLFKIEVSQPPHVQETYEGLWVQAWVLVPHGRFEKEDET
jgi:hypothetical protein